MLEPIYALNCNKWYKGLMSINCDFPYHYHISGLTLEKNIIKSES